MDRSHWMTRFAEFEAGLEQSDVPFHLGVAHGSMTTELFRPVGKDIQKPHAQDELYIIRRGTSDFLRGEDRVSVAAGDVLFVDEIHRLNPVVEEILYPAMEDYRLDIIIDQGPNARTIELALPRFTLVGATTRAGMLTAPLRSRFTMTNRLDYYSAEDLAVIVTRSARLLDVAVEPDGALEIAQAEARKGR